MARPNSRWCWISALQVGERSAAGLHQLVRIDAEHVVPRTGSRPHLVELQQIRIDEHAQLIRMTERRNATSEFGNPILDRLTGWS